VKESTKEIIVMILAFLFVFGGIMLIASCVVAEERKCMMDYYETCTHNDPITIEGKVWAGYFDCPNDYWEYDFCVDSPHWLPDTPAKVDLLADAIYWAEGGANTNFPYGIKSVRGDNEREYRKICKNTIKNNIRRFKEQSVQPIRKTYLLFIFIYF